jgi:hypothetical protein
VWLRGEPSEDRRGLVMTPVIDNNELMPPFDMEIEERSDGRLDRAGLVIGRHGDRQERGALRQTAILSTSAGWPWAFASLDSREDPP